MATTIMVMYEDVPELNFDMDYYLGKHMPLVQEKFARFGLKSWRVLTAKKARYRVVAELEFDTAQQFKDATAAEGRDVFGDVPNFSNKEPTVVVGEAVGAG